MINYTICCINNIGAGSYARDGIPIMRGHAFGPYWRLIMDAGTITQLIGSLGFPIAACIALFWQNSKMAERHSEELKQITEALNNNTLAITELSAKIGGMA